MFEESSLAEMVNRQDLKGGRLTRLRGGKRGSGRRNSKPRSLSGSEVSMAEAADHAPGCVTLRELDFSLENGKSLECSGQAGVG